MQKPIQRVKFTKAMARHTKIRDQNPSLGMICPGEPQRSSNAPKFEDRSQEEREWQGKGAREAAWKLAKNVLKLRDRERATFFSLLENRYLPASNLKPEEREIVVDSGASMHMISKKDLSDAEMDTLTKSCSPIETANGEVQTHEEATVYVKELGKFLTLKVIENTPAVLWLGKLCDENGYSYDWINGQKPHLIKNGIRIPCNTENFVPIVVPGLSSSSSGSSSTSTTLSRQESHSSFSSSSSSSSPTVREIKDLRVFWKLMNPPECVWETLNLQITKTILQEKVRIHYSITIWFTNLFLCLKLQKLLQQKQRWTRNGKNWRKFSAWNLTKVRSKKEVIDEARTTGTKVHFASLMDTCHLKNAELEAKHQKLKGRVGLRGDIVKDNSGSYAVFTEQGSSASQMTAAKIMDIISRLPGCDGQAADAVSACTQVKMEDAHKLLKIPKSECPDIWIRLPRHKWAKIMVQYGRPSRPS